MCASPTDTYFQIAYLTAFFHLQQNSPSTVLAYVQLVLGMTALVEIHDEDELKQALDCGAEVIGINNRNLKSMEVDVETAIRLAPLVPDGILTVAESGIRSRE